MWAPTRLVKTWWQSIRKWSNFWSSHWIICTLWLLRFLSITETTRVIDPFVITVCMSLDLISCLNMYYNILRGLWLFNLWSNLQVNYLRSHFALNLPWRWLWLYVWLYLITSLRFFDFLSLSVLLFFFSLELFFLLLNSPIFFFKLFLSLP